MVDFDHIFIINPSETFDFGTLYYVLKQINFPESQVYVFGDKPRKTYFKKILFPYWQLKNITLFDWLDKYGGILGLKDRYYLIVDNIFLFLAFSKYTANVKVINLKTEIQHQVETFDILCCRNFKCVHIKPVNHYKNESIWIKNSQ